MQKMTPEQEEQKKYIYEKMSPRRRKFVHRIGYEKWDPFQEPKNPIEIRKDSTHRTTQQLVRQFLAETDPEEYSNAYGQGVLDICLGVVNGEDRYRAMFEFSLWYAQLLEAEGKEIKKHI
ncbi:MAG: hypothetical protein ACQES5_02905 [Thermodesulfobacteriota bacterium]